ncbi:hypothetical protein P700755_003173 [Psychroflexus torquis ATCC 700755]|uniref:DUF885 domain-containing protein n=1 Tax=Psychroflexus torquis (strain ATCC 700755 / CIP 106069 / ACAM 623) TaxID=313595 RepID=K4IWI5_PSYTT|nr:hypothetical protein P700755_003173 [Psychroflexus torquis ATCC 700755]
MKYIICSIVCLLVVNLGKSQTPSRQLDSIVQTYQDHKGYDLKTYPLGLYTKTYYQQEADFASQLLTDLAEIDNSQLSETEQISLEMLKFKLKETVDFYEFEAYLNPLLSDSGFHLSLSYEVRDLNTYEQVKVYLNKLNAIPTYVDQHFKLLRQGLKKGITQPRVIFEGYESTYDSQIVDQPEDSYFYEPFQNLPSTLSESQKDSVIQAARTAIKANVIPQFRRVKSFFEVDYLPTTKTTLGVSEGPQGEAYYQNRLNYYTTLDLTAEDIHQIGLDEVARIHTEMKAIITNLGFEGSFEEFIQFLRTDEQFYAKTGEDLLKEARDIAKRIDAKLPAYFKTLPRKPYGVAKVPDAIAPKYTTGRYIGASNDTQPGYYWVNTYNLTNRPLYVLPSLTAHEAVPGHHLQNALNAELGDSIPDFRKNMYLSAYGEGWGLYSEFLAEEMGIYTTAYERFGKLTYEQWRACRLVIDGHSCHGMDSRGSCRLFHQRDSPFVTQYKYRSRSLYFMARTSRFLQDW